MTMIRNSKCVFPGVVFGMLTDTPQMPVLFLSLLHTGSLHAFSLLYFYLDFVFDLLPEMNIPENQDDYFLSQSPALLYPHLAYTTTNKPDTWTDVLLPAMLWPSVSGHYRLQSLGFSGLDRHLGLSETFSYPSWEVPCNTPSKWTCRPRLLTLVTGTRHVSRQPLLEK